ncbi:MAG TPA: glycoside hydrolase family 130 protein [Opitutaceae bacterium]|nr:glycoside hydrolase family 130 protein [Opitutaceae bacterium]
MALNLQRSGIVLRPESSRVFFRPFDMPNRERLIRVLARVMTLPEEAVRVETERMLSAFADRHLHLREYLLRRFAEVEHELITDQPASENRRLLIGAYLTLEYSMEAAALFNPSVVPHPNQSGVPKDSLRLVLSLRATGEGHLSSIVFRTALIDGDGQISVTPPTRFAAAAAPYPNTSFEKRLFARKLAELGLLDEFASSVLDELDETFTLEQLRPAVDRGLRRGRFSARDRLQHTASGILALAQSNYELRFDPATRLSERVIFPNTPAERRGIEDARWVAFREEEGGTTYYATYSAYDGNIVLPQIVETADFLNFRINTLNGPEIRNKGMALFPRKLNGRYAMISRQDGENLFIMFSELLHFWYEKRLLLRPTEPWEFIQLGNCGSPIETEEGWLVLTHGVGAMRRYVLGAILLDRDDPTRVIGRLREPLLTPSESEREGYVPNVVYSCGGLVHAGRLLIPYAMSDQSTSFATLSLGELLAELRHHRSSTS